MDTPLEKICNGYHQYLEKEIDLKKFLEIVDQADKESDKF